MIFLKKVIKTFPVNFSTDLEFLFYAVSSCLFYNYGAMFILCVLYGALEI